MAEGDKVIKEKVKDSGLNAVYCLGIIGALFYFIQQATSFWDGVVGVIKAILWPAFLIYSLLNHLNF